MLHKGMMRNSHMAHVLKVAQRRSNLIKGILLLLRLFLDLLTILICSFGQDIQERTTQAKRLLHFASGTRSMVHTRPLNFG